jgi:hypothetical protein
VLKGSTTVNVSLTRRVLFFAVGFLMLVEMPSSPALAGDFLRDFNKTLDQTNRAMQRGRRLQRNYAPNRAYDNEMRRQSARERRWQAQEAGEMRRQAAIERQRKMQESRERWQQERAERRRQEAERQRQIYESMTPEQQAAYREKRRKEEELAARILGGIIIGGMLGGGGGSSASGDDHLCARNPSAPACGGSSYSSPAPQPAPTPPIHPNYGSCHNPMGC